MTYINTVFQRSCESMSEIPDGVVQCTVTSPPYYAQRDYGIDGQIGVEQSMDEYRDRMRKVFAEVYRVTADDGVLWLNLGDTYFGDSPIRKSAKEAFSKTWDKSLTRSRGGTRRSAARQADMKVKDLMFVPHTIAADLRAMGWYSRMDVVWWKGENAVPGGRGEADRPGRSHEYVFLFSKSRRYFIDKQFLPKGSVWHIPPSRYKGAHFATMPERLAWICVMSGAKPNYENLVLDPFMGAGTTALTATQTQNNYVGYELNPAYCDLIQERLGLFAA